jgi:hypothetical protein
MQTSLYIQEYSKQRIQPSANTHALGGITTNSWTRIQSGLDSHIIQLILHFHVLLRIIIGQRQHVAELPLVAAFSWCLLLQKGNQSFNMMDDSRRQSGKAFYFSSYTVEESLMYKLQLHFLLRESLICLVSNGMSAPKYSRMHRIYKKIYYRLHIVFCKPGTGAVRHNVSLVNILDDGKV